MKYLMASFLLSMNLMITACGSQSSSKNEAPAPSTTGSSANFSAVNTALKASCAGSSCHGPGASNGVFVDNQANVDAYKKEIYSEVSSGRMPLRVSISAANKEAILSYTKP